MREKSEFSRKEKKSPIASTDLWCDDEGVNKHRKDWVKNVPRYERIRPWPAHFLSRTAHPLELIALYFIHIWWFAPDRFWLATEFELCVYCVFLLVCVFELWHSCHHCTFSFNFLKAIFIFPIYAMRYCFVSIIFPTCTRWRAFSMIDRICTPRLNLLPWYVSKMKRFLNSITMWALSVYRI